MEKHIVILGIVYIVFGILGVFAGAVVFLVLAGSGFLTGERELVALLGTVGALIGGFLLVLSLPGIIGGWGLLKMRRWSRTLLIVIGILNLVNIPVGTIVGVYTLWVLMNDEVSRKFSSIS